MAIHAAVPHKFTIADYHRMAETGVLSGDARVGVIEGETVEMTPMAGRHALCVTALKDAFHACGVILLSGVQCPVQITTHIQLPRFGVVQAAPPAAATHPVASPPRTTCC